MKFDLKEMYSYLLSHTFPGLLFLSEILLFLQNAAPHEKIIIDCSGITNLLQAHPVILVLVGYAFSTLLGTMLDGIQHCIFDRFVEPAKKRGMTDEERAEKKYTAIMNNDKAMEVYKHFIEDDLWYPYEAYANISGAMIFGLILLLFETWLRVWFWWGPIIIFISILGALIYEAMYTFALYHDEEEQFLKAYSRSPMSCKKDNNVKG